MHRVVAIGIDERVQIFSLIGFEVFSTTMNDFESLLAMLVEENIAIIYVDEILLCELKTRIKIYQTAKIPAIVPISLGAYSSIGKSHIQELAKKAIGMDMN